MTFAYEKNLGLDAAAIVVITAFAFLIRQAGRDQLATAVTVSGVGRDGFRLRGGQDRAGGRSRWRRPISSTGESTYATAGLPQRGRAYPAGSA